MSSNNSRILISIGDLVEDIVVWRAGRSAGGVTGDITANIVIGTDNPASIVRSRGGSAANVAIFAARRQRTGFIGRVGTDPIGQALVDDLVAAGVQPLVQRSGRTGTIVVHIDHTGERTMFPDRGAAAELADVPVSWVNDAAVLHISGYALAEPDSARTVVKLSAAARVNGALISLDAASADLLRTLGAPAYLALVNQIRPDFYFANADEAAALPLQKIIDLGATCVAKDGEAPVTVMRTGFPDLRFEVDRVAVVHDTTGAGDAFAAGFLCAVMDAEGLEAAVRTGNRWAAGVLSQAGANFEEVA